MTIALDHRTKVIIGAVVMVLIVVAGWFLGIAPQLESAAIASSQTATVLAANSTAQAKLDALALEADSLPDLQAQLSELSSSVPSSADSSALLTQINSMAAAAGVVVDGVTLDVATAYMPPAPVDPGLVDPAAPVAEADPSATAYVDPRITSANFILIPVSINVTGANANVLSFLAGIQGGPRLFLVSTYSSTRNASAGESAISENSEVSAAIGGYVYVLVDSANPTLVDAAAAPAA